MLATLGLAQASRRLLGAGVAALALGAMVHALAFFELHGREPTPSLVALPSAVSLAAWMGTLFFLGIHRRARLVALVALIAPAAFLGAFFAALQLPGAEATATGSAAWSHAHILLASAGLALLGIAGLAGALYVVHHRRIKTKRPLRGRLPLPPLEALDRVNVIALSLGFLLLSLGVVTGMMWVNAMHGVLWPGTAHANATLLAWAIYAALVFARFGAHQGARRSAQAALAGFAVLLFAVVGVELLS